MENTIEQTLNFITLTDEQIAACSREELEMLLRGEQEIKLLIQQALIDGLTRELVLKDQVLTIQQNLCRLQTILFKTRSEKLRPRSYLKKSKRTQDKKRAEDTTKLPSERYPEADIIERMIDCVEKPVCPCCAETMQATEMFSVSEALSVIPKRFVIIRQKKRKYRCQSCKSSIVTTPSPPRIVRGSSYGDELIIDVSLSKYSDLIPVERYSRIAAMEGFEGLPANSLIELTHPLADFLRPEYELVKAQALESRVLQADETIHRMLEGDKKSKWFLWGFSTIDSCFFECHDTRSGDVASRLLNQSQCEVLVSDVFSGYAKAVRETNAYRQKEGIGSQVVNAYCNSHARRGFVDLAVGGDLAAQFMIDCYADCQEIEKQCKGKAAPDVLSLREGIATIFEKMKNFATEQVRYISDKSALAKAFRYFTENYEGLSYFLKDAETPMDNNQSERLLRSAVIGRKTWLGTHSRRGAQTAAIHFTLVESCKLIDLNPRLYYREAVARHHKGLPPLSPRDMKIDLAKRSESGSSPPHSPEVLENKDTKRA